MTSMGKTLAIVNPAARNGDGARGAAFLRYAAGSIAAPFEGIQIETTREAGHATALAAQASNFDCVLAVGGDGVVHETLAGLMRIPREKRPAFALIPCGNGNDYARTLGMSFVMEEALTQLSSAQRISADVGVCNGEYFAETLSFGLDAAIALGTYERRRRTGREGTRLFVEEGANQLVFHRDAYDFTAIADGGTSKQGSMHLFAVQVGPTYGGGFRVCPNADATDGKLDCCFAGGLGRVLCEGSRPLMSTFTFVLILGAAVLVSSAINQVVSGVATPLIQIGIGVLLAFAGLTTSNFQVDPELFLVLFIAPLLYHEARNTDKVALWSNRAKVLSLAVGLVVVTILCIGFTLHALEPTIPLAAAFALGAALGPTDAVAVASLSKRVSLKRRQSILLSGESLINDASGVVSFQFSIAALTTGTFSLISATGAFLVSFFGGIAFGLVLAALLAFLVSRVRDLGLEDTTFHVLLEVLTPFAVFLTAEHVGVSGILAVVAAGLSYSFFNRDLGPSIARMKIVSSSVWRVLSFVLNGLVFVLLGIQLPHAMMGMWEEKAISNGELFFLVLVISAIVIGVRTLWFVGISYVGRKQVAQAEQRNSGGTPEQVRRVLRSIRLVTPDSLKESLALALAGPKGAITLSIMFTLPWSLNAAPGVFSQREFLIFLACGVILVTLLLANFALPALLPDEQGEKNYATDTDASIEVLRATIEELAARQTRENRRATQTVMAQYNDRIDRIKQGTGEQDDDSVLRLEALEWEQEYVLSAIDEERVSPVVGYRMLRRIRQSKNLIQRDRDVLWLFGIIARRAALVSRSITRTLLDSNVLSDGFEEEREVRQLQAESLEYVVKNLRARLDDPNYRTEHVSSLMVQVQRDLRRVKRIGRDIGTVARVEDKATEVRRAGFLIELEHIQQMYESGRINRHTAKHMRENVHMMQLELEDKV